MAPRFPQHVALELLYQQGQYEPCRMVAEKLIAELMAPPQVGSLVGDVPSVEQAFKRWQERDLELSCLHINLSRALLGLHDHESAASKADMAALLANKAGDQEVAGEALHVAGVCYSQAGNYRLAVDRFTECLNHAAGLLRAKALYNRGHAYGRQGAYSFAAPDYAEALRLAAELDQNVARVCRINLAWTLTLLRDFQAAEELLTQLATSPGADSDRLLQVQLAHDRLHMAYLLGQGRDALRQALAALRGASKQYPHVRARIALTLMSVSTDNSLPEQACTLGVLAKRLAGQAKRPDIDEEAGRQLQTLEFQAGTECLMQSLQKAQQVAPGAVRSRQVSRRSSKAGGVG